MEKERILEAFRALGFELQAFEEVGYSFQYEGTNFLYIDSGGDEHFLSISIPEILELGEENRTMFYQLMDSVNSKRKYVKAYSFIGKLWLFYERELIEEDHLEEVISHMILHLDATFTFVRSLMTESDAESEVSFRGQTEEEN